jgi:hypothetical protein
VFSKFKCAALRKLNLMGCRLLPDVQLRNLLDTVPLLSELNLSACAGLRELYLSHTLVRPRTLHFLES